MKYYLLILLNVNVLLAGTYDDPYLLTKTNKNLSYEDTNPFMHGRFLEIKRFNSLLFVQSELNEFSQLELNKYIDVIKSYIEKKKTLKITVIGHTASDTNEDSLAFAQNISKQLEDNSIDKSLITVESRASKDQAYIEVNDISKSLSNRVMITMYVIAPEDKDGDGDGDGVLDSIDKCPDTLINIQVDKDGCPLDTDKDGILDYLDACPDNPNGVEVDEKGCPLDNDTDGVPDYKDKCLDTIESLQVDADGCHIARELKLNFAPKSSEIADTVYSQVTEFATFLKEHAMYNAKIVGHTDSVGRASSNMKLSYDRADAVRNALINEGIDAKRLESFGRGELSPLETNRTEVGRATNRRIEVKIFN